MIFFNLILTMILVQSISPEGALYETCYVTAHKGPCRAGAFHSSGKLIATGSEDASIKVCVSLKMLKFTLMFI